LPTITTDDDAPPIVRILAATLRRTAAQPSLASQLDKMSGVVALRSIKDPQAATIRFDKGAVRVATGVADDADVVISADLDTMGRPGAPKPKVKGAARHLPLALAVSKVLDPPVPGGWRGAARELWTWAEGQRGRPDRMRVVCTDDGGELELGEGGGTTVEVHGPAWALTAALTGGDHLGAAVLEGRLKVVASLPVMSEMVGLMTALMLGEERRG
jgi:hypothetical protein